MTDQDFSKSGAAPGNPEATMAPAREGRVYTGSTEAPQRSTLELHLEGALLSLDSTVAAAQLIVFECDESAARAKRLWPALCTLIDNIEDKVADLRRAVQTGQAVAPEE